MAALRSRCGAAEVDRDPERNFLATNHGRDQWDDGIAAELDGRIRGLRMHVVQDLGGFPRGTDLAELTVACRAAATTSPRSSSARAASTPTRWRWAPTGRRASGSRLLRRARHRSAGRCGGAGSGRSARRNFIAPFDNGYTTASGARYDTGDYAKALDYAIEVSGYEALRAEQAAARKNGRYLGIGLASYVEICGFGPFECDRARRDQWRRDGLHGHLAPWSGAGNQLRPDRGRRAGSADGKDGVNHGDTLNTPQGNGTMGSRGLAVGGGAVVMAMDKVRDRAKAIAAHLLEAAAEDIEIVEAFRVRGVPDRVSGRSPTRPIPMNSRPSSAPVGRPSTSALTMRHSRLAPTSRSSRSFPTRVK